MVRLTALLLLSAISLCTYAQQYNDAYRVDVPVADQSEAARTVAAKATLGDVIVKITGDVAALQHPLVRQAIANAPDYLQQFSYSTDRDKTTADNIKITLNYSSQAIDVLLRQAQLKSAQQNSQVMLYVKNIKDFTAFKQSQTYLKTIPVIRHIELSSVNKDELVFSALLDSDITTLKNILAATDKLQIDESVNGNVEQPSKQLIFQWQHL